KSTLEVELKQIIEGNAEKAKLRDAELNTRIMELERSVKENEDRFAKLEQKQNNILDPVINQCIDTNSNSLDDSQNEDANASEEDLSYGSTETILSKNGQDGNLCDMKTVPSGNDRDENLSCGTKTISSENDQTEISELERDVECDKNEIVEQGLIEELHLSTDKQSLINSAIDNTNSTEINPSENKDELEIRSSASGAITPHPDWMKPYE
ncbi:41884_t:CDS:2, partial [Gigaspora margarita]